MLRTFLVGATRDKRRGLSVTLDEARLDIPKSVFILSALVERAKSILMHRSGSDRQTWAILSQGRVVPGWAILLVSFLILSPH